METEDGGAADGDGGARSGDRIDGFYQPMVFPRLPSLSEMGLLEMRPRMIPTLASTMINHNLAEKTYDWRELKDGGTWRYLYPTHQIPSKTSIRHGTWHHYDGPVARNPLSELGMPFVRGITYENGDKDESGYIHATCQPSSLRYSSLLPWQRTGSHRSPRPDPGLENVSYETDYRLSYRDESMAPSLLTDPRNDETLAMEALMAAANRHPANDDGQDWASAVYRGHKSASALLSVGSSNSLHRTSPGSSQPNQHYCDFPGCGKGFPSKSRLQRHAFVHTGERPFACLHSQCNRRFSRKDNMLQHYRTHLIKGLGPDHNCEKCK